MIFLNYINRFYKVKLFTKIKIAFKMGDGSATSPPLYNHCYGWHSILCAGYLQEGCAKKRVLNRQRQGYNPWPYNPALKP